MNEQLLKTSGTDVLSSEKSYWGGGGGGGGANAPFLVRPRVNKQLKMAMR